MANASAFALKTREAFSPPHAGKDKENPAVRAGRGKRVRLDTML